MTTFVSRFVRVASTLILMLALVLTACNTAAPSPGDTGDTATPLNSGYPLSGHDLSLAQFATMLPPPPLDALPYDVREPLFNGDSVPVKKRWLWVPPGRQITVNASATEPSFVAIPDGSMWWKEFYVETDRGVFLIERRLMVKVVPSAEYPHGWAFFGSYHLPLTAADQSTLVLTSTSTDTEQFMYQPSDWLPTQSRTQPLEVRFEDVRGIEHAYVFPGQRQCSACHGGAAGAYPNDTKDPILVFGIHPNSLTPESYAALVAHGWLDNADALLNPGYPGGSAQTINDATFEELTNEIVGLLRQNCASCHTSSELAQASKTAFVIDPNRAYTGDDLLALLSTEARMAHDPNPLVTPGDLAKSEIWLRLNGLEDRRRMPPREGGLPELDARTIELWRQWIIAAGEG